MISGLFLIALACIPVGIYLYREQEREKHRDKVCPPGDENATRIRRAMDDGANLDAVELFTSYWALNAPDKRGIAAAHAAELVRRGPVQWPKELEPQVQSLLDDYYPEEAELFRGRVTRRREDVFERLRDMAQKSRVSTGDQSNATQRSE